MIIKKSVYLGGEASRQQIIIPDYYEDFFKKSLLFFIIGLVCLLLVWVFI